MTNLPLPPFTMLRISYSAKNVVRYRCNNIVLGGKGGANAKSQKFLHLIVAVFLKLVHGVFENTPWCVFIEKVCFLTQLQFFKGV